MRAWWRRHRPGAAGDLVLSVAGPSGTLLSLSVDHARAAMQLLEQDPWCVLETREGIRVTLSHDRAR